MDKKDYHYSGDNSKAFWERVNALEERWGELYALGVALQNLEGQVLRALVDAERDEKNLATEMENPPNSFHKKEVEGEGQ